MDYKEKLYLGIIRYLGELPLERAESYWENKLGLYNEDDFRDILLDIFTDTDLEIFDTTFVKSIDNESTLFWTDVIEYIIELNDLPSPPVNATYDTFEPIRISEDSKEYQYYIKQFLALESKVNKLSNTKGFPHITRERVLI